MSNNVPNEGDFGINLEEPEVPEAEKGLTGEFDQSEDTVIERIRSGLSGAADKLEADRQFHVEPPCDLSIDREII